MRQTDFLSSLLNEERSDDSSAVVHICVNADCFYCETIMDFHELVWKDAWDSTLEMLTPIPHCPSCGEVIWRERA